MTNRKRATCLVSLGERTVRAILVCALLGTPYLTVCSTTAAAQASSSSDVAGTVLDTTGAAVPGATVHLIHNGTGVERTATSNNSGQWSIPNLPPANYRIRVEKEGFRAVEIPSLDIEIGKTANGSVTLNPGAVSETVEVTAVPPQLQTQEATVGQVIDQKQINDLPLNGRNVLQLATLAPGVSPAQQAQTGNPCGVCGTNRQLYITVDGGRASSTNYVLDGTYIRSVRYNTLTVLPNVDAIQEFNLLRSVFSTEYGQGQSVVSMVTKSGTNDIHGTAYEFARNSIFDARNYFAPVYTTLSNGTQVFNPKPDFYRQQFGATLGAPILKNKLFIFGGYEGLRSQRNQYLTGRVPTQNGLNGIWDSVDSLPGASGGYSYSTINPPGFTVTSKAAQALNPTYPVVTSDALTILGSANYALTKPFQDSYDQYIVRSDWTISPSQTLFARYADFNATQLTPLISDSYQGNPMIGRNAVLGHTFVISPKIVNEARVGWNGVYQAITGVIKYPNTNWAAAEGLQNITALTSPRQNGRAAFAIQGYTSMADGQGDSINQENVISLGDSLSMTLSKHTLKFGFQFQNRRLWQATDQQSRGTATFDNCTAATYAAGYKPTGPDDPNNVVSVGNCPIGQKGYEINGVNYLYNKFQNYARGMCTSSCNGNDGNTLGHYRDNTYGAFVNDIWQLTRSITLNLGLRWEYSAPFVEQNGLEGTLDPTSGLITFSKIPSAIPSAYLPYLDLTRTYRPGIIEPKKLGFMPRVGVAWEARPGTVFRAGGGVYMENLNGNELQFTRVAPPLYFQQSFTNVFTNTLFPDPLTNKVIPAPFSIDPKNSRPYTQEWNLSMQQALSHNTILEIAYTGSNSHRLWKRYEENMYIQYPYVIPTSYVRPYPQFGNGVLASVTRADANFNGGSVKVEQRPRGGLYYLASYQWSKNIDNGSGEAGANDSSFATDLKFDRSLSNFDVRNRAVISGGYELPFGKGKHWLQTGVGNALAGGWSLQPAVQLRSGYPFNVSGSGCTFSTYNACRVFLAPGKTISDANKINRTPFTWFDATAFSQSPTTATVTRNASGAYVSTSRPLPNLQGWVTRNVLTGPGTASVDLSALKNVHIYERVNAQFRAEAYNIINHPVFGQPAASIGTASTVGRISGTSLDNRSIQLALKVLW